MEDSNPKRLYRSRREKVFGGVCAGIAEYFNIDPTFVRLAFVLGFFMGFGMTLIVYIICWLVVPLAPIDQTSNETKK